jgi:hypothetical protein
MRSSKARSRSKSNRNRSMGNIVNRVFDSSGPEGKVRGTPQQIIDKYNQLARDAQLGNDRVAFENFQQHAEHYTRMLSEAQREQDQRREQHEREQEARREQRDDSRGQNNGQGGGDQPQSGQQQDGGGQDDRPQQHQPAEAQRRQDDVIDMRGDESGDSGLVETPESKPSRPRRQRRPKNQGDGSEQKGDGDQSNPAEAAE